MGLIKQLVFEFPKVFRKVDLVVLRVDYTAIFGEKLFDIFVFSVANFFERRHIVDEFSVFENIHHKFLDFVVLERGLFPRLFRMENREWL